MNKNEFITIVDYLLEYNLQVIYDESVEGRVANICREMAEQMAHDMYVNDTVYSFAGVRSIFSNDVIK